MGGEQRGDQVGVVRRLRQADRLGALVADLGGEFGGVGQVAVVPQRDAAAVRGRAVGRLGVLPVARTGGGVAGVADGEVPAQRGEGGLVEHLGDQAELLVDHDGGAVGHRHPGGLLAAVLERVQTEVGQLGDVLARRPDAEHAAGVAGGLLGFVRLRRRAVRLAGPVALVGSVGLVDAGVVGHATALLCRRA
jgi:hypothetical protein